MKKNELKVTLVTNDDYLPALLKLLDQTKKSVDIIAFSFAIGSAKGTLSEKSAPFLIAKKLTEIIERSFRKIKIRLYLEGTRETNERNRVTAAFLKKAGVEIKYGATHAKGFLIDDRYILFGSTNLTNQSIQKNNETNLLIDGKQTAKIFEKYFMHLWKGGKHGGVILPLPFVADGGFKDGLVKMIDSAKKQIEFSIYFFQQADIEKALIRAYERKVKIRGFIHDHYSFALSYVYKTKRTVNRLKEAGITDLHYGPKHLFTHSKFLIKDRKELALGTGNWLDEDIEIHPQLYIFLNHTKLATKLAIHLQKQIRSSLRTVKI